MKAFELNSWKQIKNYFETINNNRILSYFDNPEHLTTFTFDFKAIYFDFSKHRWNQKMLKLFVDFAEEMQTRQAIEAMFTGQIINKTEQRAVLHTALRQPDDKPVVVNGKNRIPEIREAEKQIKIFSEKVISGQWKGISGESITDVVNIGIGGSDLGPKMVVKALSNYRNHLNIHFLSNIDPFELDRLLDKINLKTTLFVIVSKSFSTQETLTNAQKIQEIYIDKFGKKSIAKHFVTVSTQKEKAQKFGIAPENIFPMWDWVGGRYSLWSPAGTTIPLAIGYKRYQELKSGAYAMDTHFRQEKFDRNLPVIAAFLTILYNNLYDFETEAYIPYADKLRYLPDFLQQLIMESNGKSVDISGKVTHWQTGNIVWGNIGTNAQHSFFQLLHQGTKIVPVNFIAEKVNKNTRFKENHKILLANMVAQAEALMIGDKNDISSKNFEGNRPSTTILLDEITPKSLGSLLAYYEHKTFTEAWFWQINAFDQFGVELGKRLAKRILEDFEQPIYPHDISTQTLIQKISK